MSTGLIKSLLLIWAIAASVFFLIIGLNYLFFGDQTGEDSFKPLFIIIPIMGAALFTLIKLTNRQ
jgi:hypothetical protein